MNLEEKELKSNIVYRGRILDLKVDDILLPNGGKAVREYVEHRGGAGILAVDEESYVYLVKQFRYPYREVIYEIPAGKLESGEDPAVTAKRELEEETGLIGDIHPYGLLYPTPGYTNEKLYVYLADNLSSSTSRLDEDEFLDVVKLQVTEALALVKKGTIKDAKTVYALLRYAMEHNIKIY